MPRQKANRAAQKSGPAGGVCAGRPPKKVFFGDWAPREYSRARRATRKRSRAHARRASATRAHIVCERGCRLLRASARSVHTHTCAREPLYARASDGRTRANRARERAVCRARLWSDRGGGRAVAGLPAGAASASADQGGRLGREDLPAREDGQTPNGSTRWGSACEPGGHPTR